MLSTCSWHTFQIWLQSVDESFSKTWIFTKRQPWAAVESPWKQYQTLFFGAPKSLQMVIAAMKLKDAYSLEGKLWPTWIAYSKARHYFANKGLSSQGSGFSSGHVWMWELDYEESWVWKNWCFWTVVLEKTLESPLDCEELMETVKDFIWRGSKIPVDGDCSHEIKRNLLLGRKVMTNLDSILKSKTLLCQQRSI